MTNENVKEMRALSFLDNKPIHMMALESSLLCNLTSYALLLLLCEKKNLSTNHNTLRGALKFLSKPAKEFGPLLREIPMRIQGRSGSSIIVYTMTDFGRSTMKLKGFMTPESQDLTSLAHRYIQMEVYIHALKSGAYVEIEKVLPYDNQHKNIRVDILASFASDMDPDKYPTGEEYLFEAEQELLPSNSKRAITKVNNWQAYGLTVEHPKIVIVFNIPTKKLARTLNIWREALQTLGNKMTFQISYILLNDLLDLPIRDAVREYSVTFPPVDETEKPKLEDVSKFAHQVRSYQPDFKLELDFYVALMEWRESYTDVDRVEAFFALMRCIHQASDITENSPVFLYNILPIDSLGLLYRYLTLEENQTLYDDLRQAIQWVQGRGNMGVTMLREINTQIIWDVFLAHHHFARGGKLKVSYEIADYTEKIKSFGVLVFYNENKSSLSSVKDSHPDDVALEWVLTALFTYSEILGLGSFPWKKKSKK